MLSTNRTAGGYHFRHAHPTQSGHSNQSGQNIRSIHGKVKIRVYKDFMGLVEYLWWRTELLGYELYRM